MWEIDKEFGFDYGHRVHNQRLIKEFSLKTDCVCKHLHGHRGRVHVFLSAPELDGGMVTDFHHLNWVKHFLDDYIDHKFILDVNDPWFERIINGKFSVNKKTIVPNYELTSTTETDRLALVKAVVPGTKHVAGRTLDTSLLSGPEMEFYEGFFLVDFVPTSENLSKWLFDCIDVKMKKIGINVSKVDWYETPKSKSSYRRD